MNRKRFNVLGSFAVLALLASCESGTVSVCADSSSGASSQVSSSEVPTSSESSSSSSSSSLKDYTPDDGKSYTLTDEMIKNVSDNNITFNGRFILYEAPKDSDYLTNDPCPYGITVKMDDGLYYAGSALQDHSTNKLGVHETTIFPNSEGYACIASSVNLLNQNYDVCDFKMADSVYKNELGELKADYFQADYNYIGTGHRFVATEEAKTTVESFDNMCDVYNSLTSALTYGGGGSNSLLGYDYIESVYLYTDDDNNIVGYGQVNTVTFSSTGMRFQTNLYADIENYGTTVVDKDSVLANYPTFTTSEALKTRY